jgi:hypothetical protein
MLLRFRFSNVRSFREEQELSLVAGSSAESPEVVRHEAPVREGVLPVAAIYGANASGKTNVLRGLDFMQRAVLLSHRLWAPEAPIPREPFRRAESPSEFEVDFVTGGIRYQYGFRVDSMTVLEEWLYAYPRRNRQTWFHRVLDRPITFGERMPGENRVVEELTRKNSLFLSAAAQNNHEAIGPIYNWIASQQFVIGGREQHLRDTTQMCRKLDFRRELERLIVYADLGISGMDVNERPPVNEPPTTNQSTIAQLMSLTGTGWVELKERIRPFGPDDVHLTHRIGDLDVIFHLQEESQGTVTYFSLLGPAVLAIRIGSPLFIDELDASLHPHLSSYLIRLFNDDITNPKGAQLIFTTHDTNLLSNGILRRDQIWFTEKKRDGASDLFPLSDFKPRRAENLENGYLQGRYGAIPFVNSEAFLARFENGKK